MPEKPPEHRRPDPLRREPPTLDLKAKELKPGSGKGSAAKPSATAGKSAAPAAAPTPAGSAAAQKSSPASGPSAGLAAATASAPKPQPQATAGSDIPVRRRPVIDFGVPPTSAAAAVPAGASAAAPKGAATPAPSPATPARPAGATATTSGPSAGTGPAAAAKPASAEPAKPAAAASGGSTRESVAPTTPPPARRGAGFGTVLTTGLLGGLIGAGIVYGVDHYLPDMLPNRAGPGQNVDARLAALEQRVSAAPASSGDNAAIDRRVAALESANRSLSEQVASRQAPAASGAPAAQVQPANGDLANRVAALEDSLKQAGSARDANAQAVADIRSQLQAVRASIDDQIKQSGAAAQTNATALAELNSRVSALQSQGASQAEAANTAVQAMQGRLNDDEKKLGQLSDQLAKFGPASAQAGLRVILSGRLNDALRDGQPLGPLLDTARKIGAPADAVAPLEPYANAPAPNAAALEQEFEPLGRRIVDAARGPATSIGDRLLRMADRIVTVRDAGETSGTDVQAQVARIENALRRGALAEAATAWDGLPDQAKSVSSQWAQRLKQRAAASEAARRLSTDALAAIDASLR